MRAACHDRLGPAREVPVGFGACLPLQRLAEAPAAVEPGRVTGKVAVTIG